MSPLLRVSELTVSYGGLLAVDDISFDVPERGLVGLIGPNGAGKTTCIDALCGFVPLATGLVELAGTRIDGWPPHRVAREGLVRTFQSVELFEDLSVRENLLVAATEARWWSTVVDAIRPRRGQSVDVEWALDAVGLGGEGERLPSELAHGRRRLVGLARALASRPQLVLLDEPGAGLDAVETAELGLFLRQLPDLGIAVLLVDHDMGLVLGACETIHVLDFGRIIATGAPAEVRGHPDVVRAYLGQDIAADGAP